jgi:hypothetical protein
MKETIQQMERRWAAGGFGKPPAAAVATQPESELLRIMAAGTSDSRPASGATRIREHGGKNALRERFGL